MVDYKDIHEAECPRCGSSAEWSFTNAAKTVVAVVCSECGRFEIPREEFDRVVTERVEADNLP